MTNVYITKEGLEKLKEELEHLKKVRRKEVIERIKDARGFGDLSENSEYDNAKEEQAFVEGRILEIEDTLKNAKIIQKGKADKVEPGSKVKVSFGGQTATYEIVGKSESDPASFRISSESPLGQALLEKKKGDKIKVKTPAGQLEYKIISIE